MPVPGQSGRPSFAALAQLTHSPTLCLPWLPPCLQVLAPRPACIGKLVPKVLDLARLQLWSVSRAPRATASWQSVHRSDAATGSLHAHGNLTLLCAFHNLSTSKETVKVPQMVRFAFLRGFDRVQGTLADPQDLDIAPRPSRSRREPSRSSTRPSETLSRPTRRLRASLLLIPEGKVLEVR